MVSALLLFWALLLYTPPSAQVLVMFYKRFSVQVLALAWCLLQPAVVLFHLVLLIIDHFCQDHLKITLSDLASLAAQSAHSASAGTNSKLLISQLVVPI